MKRFNANGLNKDILGTEVLVVLELNLSSPTTTTTTNG